MKKIVLPKYSMPVTRPGGCCGTAASKNFVFGNQDVPTDCCALIEPGINVVNYNPTEGTQEGDIYTFANLECTVTLCFSVTVSNPDAPRTTLTFWKDIGGNVTSQIVPIDGTTFCADFNNGDRFYFYAESDECNTFTVSAINQTCGTNLGVIEQISVFFDPACTICPPWDLGNRHSMTQQLSHSWQLLGPNQPLTIRLEAQNNVLNFTTSVIAYVNTIPSPVGSPTSGVLMEFGTSFGSFDFVISPGEYLIIVMEVFDTDCADVNITFNDMTCGQQISNGMINKFEVNKGAC